MSPPLVISTLFLSTLLLSFPSFTNANGKPCVPENFCTSTNCHLLPELKEKCCRCHPYNLEVQAACSCSDPSTSSPTCVDSSGNVYQDGETFPDDEDYPCVRYRCSGGQISVVYDLTDSCTPPSAPDCLGHRDLGDCCYHYNCPDPTSRPVCFSNGQVYQVGDTWYVYDPRTGRCTYYRCNEGGVTVGIKSELCLKPPEGPHALCVSIKDERHCCPQYNCDCFYNGEVYEDGEDFPDNPEHPCQQKQCSYGVVIDFTTEINCPPLDCPPAQQIWPIGECCRICNASSDLTCVDSSGNVRQDGEVYSDNEIYPCVKYRCVEGQEVLLYDLRGSCPDPVAGCTPHRDEGQCCYTYDCSTPSPVCVDSNGQTYPVGGFWHAYEDGQCVHYQCTDGGIPHAVYHIDCLPPTDPSCIPYFPFGSCCPSYHCPTQPPPRHCIYNGQIYQDGDTFDDDPNHPCQQMICSGGLVIKLTTPITCPPLPCPVSSQIWPDGECCRICDPSGDEPCVDSSGNVHQSGEFYTDDDVYPCIKYKCEDGQEILVYDLTGGCLGPPPGHDCTQHRRQGQCCYSYNCTTTPSPNCVDNNGQTRAVGEYWHVYENGQCVHYQCFDGGEVRVIYSIDCRRSPGPFCIPFFPPGSCCPSYHCPTQSPTSSTTTIRPPPPPCVYLGQVYQEGDTFYDNPEHPCQRKLCSGGNVVDLGLPISCPPIPSNCANVVWPIGECCRRCDQLVEPPCTDSSGNTHESGEFYDDNDDYPCVKYLCRNGVGVVIYNLTGACQQPPDGFDCTKQRPLGQCCYNYDCIGTTTQSPNCVDNNGQARAVGEYWHVYENGQCVHYQCFDGGEVRVIYRIDCPLPTNPLCTPFFPPGSCCPIYRCPTSSTTTTTTTTTTQRPPRNCVYRGQTYLHGQIFPDDPDHQCQEKICRDGQVLDLGPPISCPPIPPNCVRVVWPINECCRRCEQLANPPCVDSSGNVHQHGDLYTDSDDHPCVRYLCSNGVEVIVYNLTGACQQPPDGFDCTKDRPLGQCCYNYDCIGTTTPSPNCVDNNGQTYTVGEFWLVHENGQCVHYQCLEGGVEHVIYRIDCQPPDDPSCTPFFPPGSCCPSYICPDPTPTPGPSPCVYNGRIYQDGDTFYDDPDHPCQRKICSDGQVLDLGTPVNCPPLRPGCVNVVHPIDECCRQCVDQDVGCVHNGVPREEGEVWPDDPQHPCTLFTCLNGQVVTLLELQPFCTSLAPPNLGCDPYRQPRHCCHSYNCTGGPGPQDLDFFYRISILLPKLTIQLSKLATTLALGQEQVIILNVRIERFRIDIARTLPGQAYNVALARNLIEILNALGFPGSSGSTSITVLIEVIKSQFASLLERVQELVPLTPDQVTGIRQQLNVVITSILNLNVVVTGGDGVRVFLVELIRYFHRIFIIPGCRDAFGFVHPVNRIYLHDPTSSRTECYVCSGATSPASPLKILDVPDDCPTLPPGCIGIRVPEECCPLVACPGGDESCLYNGVYYLSGQTFVNDPVRPCITYRCIRGQIVVANNITCPEKPPGCSLWYMDGQCCPKFDCDENPCFHQGVQREHGTSWAQDPLRPCVIFTCRNGTVTSFDRSGECEPAPRPDCISTAVPYQCCPVHNCVNITCRYDGETYAEGETWYDDEQYKCKRYRCTKQGPVKIEDLTDDCPPQPFDLCVGRRVVGRCCKVWDCPSGCRINGVLYDEGEVWYDNDQRRCIKYQCIQSLAVQIYNKLPCPDIPAPCRGIRNGTECCHYKYTCPNCMFDPQHNLIRMN